MITVQIIGAQGVTSGLAVVNAAFEMRGRGREVKVIKQYRPGNLTEIIISGPQASGKTTLARAIYEGLKDYGSVRYLEDGEIMNYSLQVQAILFADVRVINS